MSSNDKKNLDLLNVRITFTPSLHYRMFLDPQRMILCDAADIIIEVSSLLE